MLGVYQALHQQVNFSFPPAHSHPHYLRVVVGVEEVDVVWEPANTKDRDDDDKHLDYPPLVLPALDCTLSELARGVSPQVLAC